MTITSDYKEDYKIVTQVTKAPLYRLAPNGDTGLTIVFDEPAGEWLTCYILSLTEMIKSEFATQWQQVIPAYQSLTIAFDPLAYDPDLMCQRVKKILRSPISINHQIGKLVKVPVCYHADFAPDLADLANHCGLTIEQVIHLHSQSDYLVNMLGFLPGFLYLSGLDTQLHCPRKSTPALRVEAGSVAIGGSQTGIYPVVSPGGWHIIGRTPQTIFAPDSPSPFIAEPLDTIRFIAIEKNEFKQLARELKNDADC